LIEREKRWKINPKVEIPKDKIKKKINISQTYSNINPDCRIRCITNEDDIKEYSHCVKYDLGNNKREEIETSISEQQYNRIFKVIDKKPMIKDRYIVELDNELIAEVDYFLDTNDVIVEVEFSNESQMKNFVKPDWFGIEIQGNQSVSKYIFNKINNELSLVDSLKFKFESW